MERDREEGIARSWLDMMPISLAIHSMLFRSGPLCNCRADRLTATTSAGGGIVNSTRTPANLVIYGSSGLHTVNLSGGARLHGLVFAPAAAIKISGGQETYGSIIGNTVDLSGGASVHYPEGLTK